MAFHSVSSRNVRAASNFSATRGEAISNSNPHSESNAARLGEQDASTSEGTTLTVETAVSAATAWISPLGAWSWIRADQKSRSLGDRIGWINRAILDHDVDVGSVRDVLQRIRIENDEIGETAVFNLADVRAGFAAEEFRRVSGGAPENLHRR